jgi:hypothetical protein
MCVREAPCASGVLWQPHAVCMPELSHSLTFSLLCLQDKWIKKIDQRHVEEAKIEALLMEIRDRVQNGTVADDREGVHALEKQLAKAQHWVVAPPTAEAPLFKYNAPPTAFLESMLSAVHQPTQYWDAQYDASPEAGAQNGWEQKDLVHLQFGSPDSVTDAFGRPLQLK